MSIIVKLIRLNDNYASHSTALLDHKPTHEDKNKLYAALENV